MHGKQVARKANAKFAGKQAIGAAARWTALGLTLSVAALLSGCGGSLHGAHAVSEGRGVLAYRVPAAGQVQVMDVSLDLPLYQGRVDAHDLVETDPFRQEILINEKPVGHLTTSAADEYRINFKPDPMAQSAAAPAGMSTEPQTLPTTEPASEPTSEPAAPPAEPAHGAAGAPTI